MRKKLQAPISTYICRGILTGYSCNKTKVHIQINERETVFVYEKGFPSVDLNSCVELSGRLRLVDPARPNHIHISSLTSLVNQETLSSTGKRWG